MDFQGIEFRLMLKLLLSILAEKEHERLTEWRDE